MWACAQVQPQALEGWLLRGGGCRYALTSPVLHGPENRSVHLMPAHGTDNATSADCVHASGTADSTTGQWVVGISIPPPQSEFLVQVGNEPPELFVHVEMATPN